MKRVTILIAAFVMILCFSTPAKATTIESHNLLADNVAAGRFELSTDPVTFTGEVGSATATAIGIAAGILISACALSEDCRDDVNDIYRYAKNSVAGLFDPQEAYLISSFDNGMNNNSF